MYTVQYCSSKTDEKLGPTFIFFENFSEILSLLTLHGVLPAAIFSLQASPGLGREFKFVFKYM